MSFKVTEFGTNRKLICDFLLVINTNLAPIRDIAFDRSKIAICGYHSFVYSPDERFPWDDLRKILPGCQWVAKVPNGVERLPKISITWVGCTNVTDRRQTDGRWHIANVNGRSRSLKSNCKWRNSLLWAASLWLSFLAKCNSFNVVDVCRLKCLSSMVNPIVTK